MKKYFKILGLFLSLTLLTHSLHASWWDSFKPFSRYYPLCALATCIFALSIYLKNKNESIVQKFLKNTTTDPIERLNHFNPGLGTTYENDIKKLNPQLYCSLIEATTKLPFSGKIFHAAKGDSFALLSDEGNNITLTFDSSVINAAAKHGIPMNSDQDTVFTSQITQFKEGSPNILCKPANVFLTIRN